MKKKNNHTWKVIFIPGPLLAITLLFEILFVTFFIAILVMPSLSARYLLSLPNPGEFVGRLSTISFLCPVAVGIFYVSKGLYMILLLQNNRAREKGKLELLRGITWTLLAVLLYLLFNYIAGFYSIDIAELRAPPKLYSN